MKIVETNNFKEPKLFYPTVYEDDRGFFMESFNDKIQNEINIPFLQDNHSKSKKGVIRGLHYQWDKPMGKLLRVPKGAGIDVIVDIRKDSPTYGKWERFHLSEYNGNAEGAIHPLKSGLNIDWALPEKEILLSEKDKTAQTFEDYKLNPKF